MDGAQSDDDTTGRGAAAAGANGPEGRVVGMAASLPPAQRVEDS